MAKPKRSAAKHGAKKAKPVAKPVKARPARKTAAKPARKAPAKTAHKALAKAVSTVLCTPAGLASAMSLNTSGYYKFPGGLIIQWGNVLSSGDIPAGGTTVYGTFPIVFPGWFGCVIPVCDAAYDNNILFSWNIGLTTTSTVAFSAREIVSGVQTNWRVFYIAVGW